MNGVQFGIISGGKTPITVDYVDLIAETGVRNQESGISSLTPDS